MTHFRLIGQNQANIVSPLFARIECKKNWFQDFLTYIKNTGSFLCKHEFKESLELKHCSQWRDFICQWRNGNLGISFVVNRPVFSVRHKNKLLDLWSKHVTNLFLFFWLVKKKHSYWSQFWQIRFKQIFHPSIQKPEKQISSGFMSEITSHILWRNKWTGITELIKNAQSEPGPFMPMELAGHAHVKINSTDSMIVGKYSSGF